MAPKGRTPAKAQGPSSLLKKRTTPEPQTNSPSHKRQRKVTFNEPRRDEIEAPSLKKNDFVPMYKDRPNLKSIVDALIPALEQIEKYGHPDGEDLPRLHLKLDVALAEYDFWLLKPLDTPHRNAQCRFLASRINMMHELGIKQLIDNEPIGSENRPRLWRELGGLRRFRLDVGEKREDGKDKTQEEFQEEEEMWREKLEAKKKAELLQKEAELLQREADEAAAAAAELQARVYQMAPNRLVLSVTGLKGRFALKRRMEEASRKRKAWDSDELTDRDAEGETDEEYVGTMARNAPVPRGPVWKGKQKMR